MPHLKVLSPAIFSTLNICSQSNDSFSGETTDSFDWSEIQIKVNWLEFVPYSIIINYAILCQIPCFFF